MIQALHPGAAGQAVFTADGSLLVPRGVFGLSAVCVQRGTVTAEAWAGVPASRIVRNGVDVVRAQNGNRLGDGGGDGGMSGARQSDTRENIAAAPYQIFLGGGGGGGAGGYNGNGGDGGDWIDGNVGGTAANWVGKSAAAGSGGGGGGICGGRDYKPAGGGGVGLNGIGATGAGGTAFPSSAGGGSGGGAGVAAPYGTTQYGDYSGTAGGVYGGAQGDQRNAQTYVKRGRGGALAWKNNVLVYPGEILQVYPGGGAVRVIWGNGRTYPSNAGNTPTYRYYRIWMTANNGGDLFGIGELEMRATAGGPDLTTPATPCAASSWHPNGHIPGFLVNDTADAWLTSSGAAPAWVTVDMGAVTRVEELAIRGVPDEIARMPRDFIVEGSNDNATWDVIKLIAGQTTWALNTFKTFSLI